jgi:hypothetical protein
MLRELHAHPCVLDREYGAGERLASSQKGIRSPDGLIDTIDRSLDFTL